MLPRPEQIAEPARLANEIADLAILLEPLYWPRTVRETRFSPALDHAAYEALLAEYRSEVVRVVSALPVEHWKLMHERLRTDAGWISSNSHLYMLLRLALARTEAAHRRNITHALDKAYR